jgi:hypothetical protein
MLQCLQRGLLGAKVKSFGVERDPEAMASATVRVAQAGYSHVRFIQRALTQLTRTSRALLKSLLRKARFRTRFR